MKKDEYMNAIVVSLPRYIPCEVAEEIKHVLEQIAKKFKAPVLVCSREAFFPGIAKCPFCAKRFTDVSANRAWRRLNQHVMDKHREEVRPNLSLSLGAEGIGRA